MIKALTSGLRAFSRIVLHAAPVRLWAMILAGPPLTAYSIWIVMLIWRGPWSPGMEHDRLEILGRALFCLYALLAIIMVSLASVRVKATGPGGLAFEAEGDDPADPALKSNDGESS